MKLHYSQTIFQIVDELNTVSVPYEITLLSNHCPKLFNRLCVSVPYEITLLSNFSYNSASKIIVSVPYEITLLSNLK